MKSENDKRRGLLKFLALFGVAVLCLVAYYYGVNNTNRPTDAPPALETSSTIYQGAMIDDDNFLSFKDSDNPDYGDLSGTEKLIPKGFHYFSVSSSQTMSDLVKKMEPVDENRVLIAYYAEDSRLYSYPKGPFNGTEITNPDSTTIPGETVFLLISSKNMHMKGIDLASDNGESHVSFSKKGWHLKHFDKNNIEEDIGKMTDFGIISFWPLTGDASNDNYAVSSFQKKTLSGYDFDDADYNVAWFLVTEKEADTDPVIAVCGDSTVDDGEVCDGTGCKDDCSGCIIEGASVYDDGGCFWVSERPDDDNELYKKIDNELASVFRTEESNEVTSTVCGDGKATGDEYCDDKLTCNNECSACVDDDELFYYGIGKRCIYDYVEVAKASCAGGLASNYDIYENETECVLAVSIIGLQCIKELPSTNEFTSSLQDYKSVVSKCMYYVLKQNGDATVAEVVDALGY